ncbi:MAG: FixH family protein [Alphaproteobacteria bacterium]|nr:FixH family protein [Rhodospirillales bacterium]MCW9045475.1 FixH family protein [Alphaproteobacteria bacterium]
MMAQARQRSWWYPWIFVAFFAVIITVNGIMIYFATSTFTGLETDKHYVKGLKYNDNLEGVKKQAEMGWKDTTSWVAIAEDGLSRSGRINTVFQDKDGKPLKGLTIKAMVIRPTHAGYDMDVDLQSAGMGTYELAVTLPLPGLWDVRLLASRGEEHYQRVQRLYIK